MQNAKALHPAGYKWYPAAWSQGLATILGVVVGFGFLTQVQASYVSTLGLALIGLATAVMVRPLDIPVMSAAVTTALAALGAFGLHWSDHQIAVVVAALGWLAGYFVHDRVTPKAGSPYALDPSLPTPPGLAGVPGT
jgi:uncharacterized membrane protein YgaE (UPF0421/DUF939 family)